MAALDAPPRDLPRLHGLMTEPSIFDPPGREGPRHCASKSFDVTTPLRGYLRTVRPRSIFDPLRSNQQARAAQPMSVSRGTG